MQHKVTAIITALGGRDAVQSLLGVGPSAISNYLTRGEFPVRAHPVLCNALRQRGYQVNPETLAIIDISPADTNGIATSEVMTNNTLIVGSGDGSGGGSGSGGGAGKNLLLIVGGGIAAYKALEVVRRLQDHNIHVTGVMTKGAQQFITPLSLAALTEEKAYTDLFSLTDEAEMGHIRLARSADLVLVVPATANLMARTAHGMADDLATTIMLATEAPIMMAPAMNPVMWNNLATQANRTLLSQRGVDFIGPADGDTACGEFGSGRMSEPMDIVAAVLKKIGTGASLPDGPLSGRTAIVTSGPTYEPIDSVRFIANRSSGKQGHAIAAALAAAGASVTLVSGPVAIDDPAGTTVIRVETAAQMLAACEAALPADIAVCAAAVSDWHVTNAQRHKIKKQTTGDRQSRSKEQSDNPSTPVLNLGENPDILAHLSLHPNRPAIVVGFAAETENLLANAKAKRARKGCDWIIANHIASDGSPNVFGSDENTAHFITNETSEDWPAMQKTALASRLVTRIEESLDAI